MIWDSSGLQQAHMQEVRLSNHVPNILYTIFPTADSGRNEYMIESMK